MSPGFWGPVTSSIDWCEPNYKFSYYVAEPMNTITNLSFVLFSLCGAKHEWKENSKRSNTFMIMHLSVCCIGLGSMAFHGTLTALGQQLDELPMVWYLLGCGWVVYSPTIKTPRCYSLVKTFLLTYSILFSIMHVYSQSTTAFQVHFMGLTFFVLYSIYRKYTDVIINLEAELMRVCHSFVAFFTAACAMWLIDYHGCSYFNQSWLNPYGHCWWHLFMGRAAYYSIVMLKILDDTKLGCTFELRYDNVMVLPMTYRKRHPIEEGELTNKPNKSCNRLRAQSDSVV